MARRKDPRNTEWSLKAASVPKAAQYWCLNRNRDLSDNRATSVCRLGNCSRQLTFYGTDINSSSGDWEYHSGSEQTVPKNSPLTVTQRRNIIAEPLILKKKINTFESSVVPTQVMSRGTLAWLKASPAVPWEIVSTVQYCSCTKKEWMKL